MEHRPFGTSPEGAATLYTLRNARGTTARVSDFGATLVEMWTRDADGQMADVALGFDSVDTYASDYLHYLGVTAGRCGNRIRNGIFAIDGAEHHVTRNYMGHHLNGGARGFGRRLWRVAGADEGGGPSAIAFTYRSPAGEEGYPGNLDATVTYTLHADDRLEIVMQAATDAPTVVNMFNHSYFNLKGAGRGTIRNHVVRVDADRYLPVDPDAYVVTGEILDVAGTPYDLRTPRRLGDAIDAAGGGLDYGYVLSDRMSDPIRTVARIEEPESGRVLEYATDNVSIHMYDGGHMPSHLIGKGGIAYGPHAGISLETQAYPNAVNNPGFPSTILRPGERYSHTVVFSFSTIDR